MGPEAGLDLHAGPAVHRQAHLRAGPQPRLQRVELPDDGLAAGLEVAALTKTDDFVADALEFLAGHGVELAFLGHILED